jgi:hypothetical protein
MQGDVVGEEGGDDDPEDGDQGENRSVQGGFQGEAGRKPPDEAGQGEAQEKTQEADRQGFQAQDGEAEKEPGKGGRGDEGGVGNRRNVHRRGLGRVLCKY